MNLRYKYSGRILSALDRLQKGEQSVLLDMGPMTYRRIDSLRNLAKYYAREFRGFEISTKTEQSDEMTVLILSVK